MNQILIDNAIRERLVRIEERKKKDLNDIEEIRALINNQFIRNLNLSNLDDHFYAEVFIPKILKNNESEETGIEQKFGGRLPFFTNDEEWPISKNDNLPMKFVCQTIDPRSESKILDRVFIPQDDELYYSVVLKIELNDDNLSNQKIIEPPNPEFVEKCKIVMEWEKRKELKTYEYVKDNINLPIDINFNYFYFKNEFCPWHGDKIGGTHSFTQASDYSDEDFKNDFYLQLSSYPYGDAGIMHVLNDGEVMGDCC